MVHRKTDIDEFSANYLMFFNFLQKFLHDKTDRFTENSENLIFLTFALNENFFIRGKDEKLSNFMYHHFFINFTDFQLDKNLSSCPGCSNSSDYYSYSSTSYVILDIEHIQ